MKCILLVLFQFCLTFAVKSQINADGCYIEYVINKGGDTTVIQTKYFGTGMQSSKIILQTGEDKRKGFSDLPEEKPVSKYSYSIQNEGETFILKIDLIRDETNKYAYTNMPFYYRCKSEGDNIRITHFKENKKKWIKKDSLLIHTDCKF